MHHLGQLFHKGELSRPALLTSGAGCTLTYAESRTLVTNVQRQLLNAAITAPSTTPPLVVNMVLPNSIEFILAFTAIAGLGWAAAPLNPAYNASEIEFYARDVGSAMMVVARGAALAGDPAVQVAQKLGMLVVEVAFDERAKRLDLAVMHDGAAMKQHVEVAVKTTIIDPRATVLLLHTSGTTSRPKCRLGTLHMACFMAR